ncbi:MAG TPA: hypothetical protein V6D02_00845 [Candidatus Obscuribacterales bacterium]
MTPSRGDSDPLLPMAGEAGDRAGDAVKRQTKRVAAIASYRAIRPD